MAYWSNRVAWPNGRAGLVFLLEAELRYGAAKFGDEWTGEEPSTHYPAISLPSVAAYTPQLRGKEIDALLDKRRDAHARRAEQIQVMEARREAEGNSSTAHPVAASSTPTALPALADTTPRHVGDYQDVDIEFMSDVEFNAHIAELNAAAQTVADEAFQTQVQAIESQADWKHIAQAIERRNAVRIEMAGLFATDHIKTFSRPKLGGDIATIDSSNWDTEFLEQRFEWGELDPDAPFTTVAESRNRHFIFVSEESLEPMIRRLVRGRAPSMMGFSSKAGAVTACEAHLRAIFEAEKIGGGKGENKPVLREEARRKFGPYRLSGAGFNAAWANVARDYPHRVATGPAKPSKPHQ